MHLKDLILYCVAQEVKIEFSMTPATPGCIEMRAHQGDQNFSHTFTNEDFSSRADKCFLAFLEAAQRKFTMNRR